jgi:hypothetical protein
MEFILKVQTTPTDERNPARWPALLGRNFISKLKKGGKEVKFDVYNSLFLNLPFRCLQSLFLNLPFSSNIGMLIPLLQHVCQTGP